MRGKQSRTIKNPQIVSKQEIANVVKIVDEKLSTTGLNNDFTRRIKERVKILLKFNDLSNIIDDNYWKQYDSLLEEMIDMEESFLI